MIETYQLTCTDSRIFFSRNIPFFGLSLINYNLEKPNQPYKALINSGQLVIVSRYHKNDLKSPHMRRTDYLWL